MAHPPHCGRGAAAPVGLIAGLSLLFVFTQVKLQGQTVQINRASLTQSQAQAPYLQPSGTAPVVSNEAIPSPNDADLGVQAILKRQEQYDPWTASLSTPVYYTSNVALTNSGVVDDVVSAPVAAVFYQPRITKALYGLLDVREQLFYYNNYPAFDFGSLDLEAGLTYSVPAWHNLMLRAEYDFNRLTESDRVLDEFFQNHCIIVGAEIPFRFGRAQQLTLGADANISVAADHQSPRRNDYEAYAGYLLHLTRALSVNAIGRVVVRDYHQNDRTDVSEILSLTLAYQLTDWWSVSAISTFARSDSNHDVFDYNLANVGGDLALSVRF